MQHPQYLLLKQGSNYPKHFPSFEASFFFLHILLSLTKNDLIHFFLWCGNFDTSFDFVMQNNFMFLV